MIAWVEWTPGLFILLRNGEPLEPKCGLYHRPGGLWIMMGLIDYEAVTDAEAQAYLADPAVFLMEQVL